MKEVKKIKLTDAPTSKDVKKYKLESLSQINKNIEQNDDIYDCYEGIKDDLYKPGEQILSKPK